MQSRNRNAVQTLCCAVLALVLLLGLLPLRAAAAVPEKRTVTIGYNDLPGFLYRDENGNYRGYAYELLQEIAAYNNWNYEYEQVPYSQIGTKFADGSIDLYIPYQKTAARAALYEYSNEIFAENRACLQVRPDSDLYYDDFEKFDGMVIGTAVDTRNTARFADYFAKNGCTVSFVSTYDSTADMKIALDAGEIDAFVCASSRGVEDCRIICELDATNSYMLAPKGDRSLLDKVDDALQKIHESAPALFSNLENKYRISENGCYPMLTRDEVDYIAEKKSVSVIVGAQDMDAATGKFSGSIGKVLAEITQKTGLEFTPVTAKTTQAIFACLTDGTGDILFSFDGDYEWAHAHNAHITQPYAAFDAIMIKGGSVATPRTVAVVQGTYIAAAVAQLYNYELVYCDSYRDCIDLVKAGQVDAAICNATYGNYYSTFPEYGRLVFSEMFDFNITYSIAVSDKNDVLLLNILDKTLMSIPASTLNEYFNIQINSRPHSVIDVFYENPAAAIAMVVVFTAIVCALGYALLYIFSMRKKNNQLVKASSAKTDFLARMSHDMRTPLNGIKNYAQFIDEADTLAEAQDFGRKILTSEEYLETLINDTLGMSRIESGKVVLKLEPYIYNEFEPAVRNVVEPRALDKGVALHFEQPPQSQQYVLVDKLRLQQILVNIVNNGIKFTPRGGTVNVSTELLEQTRESEKICFRVQDTGIGMSKEFLKEKLFKPFSQENPGCDNEETGTGLGMSIVRQLVDLMHGTITCESMQGKGTTFTVTIPVKVTEAPVKNETKAADAGILRGKRLLLCEDHPLNREIAQRILNKAGCTIDTAEDGAVGLARFAASAPGYYNAVLMDVRMPNMDGLEATRRIRALPRADAAQIPIIAMTANAFDEDRKATREAGMTAHLAKPINPDKLYSTLAEQLASRNKNEMKS